MGENAKIALIIKQLGWSLEDILNLTWTQLHALDNGMAELNNEAISEERSIDQLVQDDTYLNRLATKILDSKKEDGTLDFDKMTKG